MEFKEEYNLKLSTAHTSHNSAMDEAKQIAESGGLPIDFPSILRNFYTPIVGSTQNFIQGTFYPIIIFTLNADKGDIIQYLLNHISKVDDVINKIKIELHKAGN